MGKHFRDINDDEDRTEGDKERLKACFLDHFLTPRARALLAEYFPEEFTGWPTGNINP